MNTRCELHTFTASQATCISKHHNAKNELSRTVVSIKDNIYY
jgi:hypothetical protein